MNNNPLSPQGSQNLQANQFTTTQSHENYFTASSGSDGSIFQALQQVDQTNAGILSDSVQTIDETSITNHLDQVEAFDDWLILNSPSTLSAQQAPTADTPEIPAEESPKAIENEQDKPAELPLSEISSSSSENLRLCEAAKQDKTNLLDARLTQGDTQVEASTADESTLYGQFQTFVNSISSREVATQAIFWSAVGVACLGNIYNGQQNSGKRAASSPPNTLFHFRF